MTVLSLTAAKAHLRIEGADDDAVLQTDINAAVAWVTKRCGPLEATPVTRRVRPSGTQINLPISPAISLTSVTPADGAAALTLSDLYLDAESGVVTYNKGSAFTARYYDVIYSAGRASVPDDLLDAVKEVLRDLWASHRRSVNRSANDEGNDPMARALKLISPHEREGFA